MSPKGSVPGTPVDRTPQIHEALSRNLQAIGIHEDYASSWAKNVETVVVKVQESPFVQSLTAMVQTTEPDDIYYEELDDQPNPYNSPGSLLVPEATDKREREASGGDVTDNDNDHSNPIREGGDPRL